MNVPDVPPASPALDRSRYALEVEDTFASDALDERLWIPAYLPQWTTADRSAARYDVGGGRLRLRIDHDQPAWSPEYTGGMRVSNLQTGVLAGPLGSRMGQHPFRDDLVVHEEQPDVALYAPRYGLFELTCRATDDPWSMVALWMIGYEDAPERSAEICVCEIFGRDVGPTEVRVGMGLHPFRDPAIQDDFAAVPVAIDARRPHTYAVEWTPDRVAWYVDERLVRVVDQSPDYPMQVMLDIFELPDVSGPAPPAGGYPKVFEVTRLRGWRPTTGRAARGPAFPTHIAG